MLGSKPIPYLVSAALLGAAVVFDAASAQDGPPPVTVAKPVVKTIVEDDEFIGRFEASAEVEVRGRVTGYLERVHFRDGQIVSKGDLLFTIDQRQFQTALRQATAQIAVAEASFDFTREQLERAERLIQSGNIAQSAVDERREAFLAAQGALEQARAAKESAEIDLEYTEIRAPLGGRIDQAMIDPGNLVTANQTVLTSIVAIDPIHFYFDIDERYYLAYARDARARGAALNEGGGALEVKVTLSDGLISQQTGLLDFSENRIDRETGTMRVRAVLPNREEILTPGLFGRVNVPGSLPHLGVLIPDEAVVADQNRRLVRVVDAEGKVSSLEIRPGPRIDGYRVVRDGLDGTETIVVNGIVRARPGATVSPQMIELPPVAADPAATSGQGD